MDKKVLKLTALTALTMAFGTVSMVNNVRADDAPTGETTNVATTLNQSAAGSQQVASSSVAVSGATASAATAKAASYSNAAAYSNDVTAAHMSQICNI
jgi:uncharacterized protein YbaA (DUF1428 family)